jgi:prophage regulatory protein
MKTREKDYLLYYLEQLSEKLKNNISEMQQAQNHILEITKNVKQQLPTRPASLNFSPFLPNNLAEKPPECLIRIREVSMLVGVSRSTIYRMIEEGNFPKPLDLGPRFKAWQKGSIVSWIVSHDDR